MLGPDGRDFLVYNGETYNFEALGPHPAKWNRSDTRVLLDLLSSGESRALAQARGMFALAYWNSDRRLLTIARDRFGVKPLYLLRHPGGGFTVASELGALIVHPDGRVIDPVGVSHFLAEGHTGPTRTLLANVQKVPPGVVIECQLDDQGSWHETQEALVWGAWPSLNPEDALRDSVRAHMVSEVEVGVFLSGGVDSTLIAALAMAETDHLQAFTIAFPERPGVSEHVSASSNAQNLGLTHHIVEVTDDQLTQAAVDLMRTVGEPLGDPAVLPLSLLAERASSHVKVVLTGEGADELVGGYRRYQFDSLTERFPSLCPRGAVNAFARGTSESPRARAAESLLWGRRRGFRAHSALLTGQYAWIDGPPSSAVALALRERELQWENLSGGSQLKGLDYDREVWLPNTYLEKTDRATMLHGLEARVPFLDPVVSDALGRGRGAMPGKEVFRAILARSASDLVLPDKKRGLAVPMEGLLGGLLRQYWTAELHGQDSLALRVTGERAMNRLRHAHQLPSSLRYRLAQLGLWRDTFPVKLK